jgi:RNase P/RNase MRP subunit POP5
VLLGAVRDSLQLNFGDHALGSALISLQVKVYNPLTGLCAIRCSRDEYRKIWCSLTLLTEIRHRVVAIRLLHLTGRMESCKEAGKLCENAAIKGLRLSEKQMKLHSEAVERLELMEL